MTMTNNNNTGLTVQNQTGLAKYDNTPTTQVSVILNQLESELINNISDKDFFNEIKRLYFLIHLELNWSTPENENDIVHTCDSIVKRFRRNPKNIRVRELETALLNGINRQYGDFMGISAVTIFGFIESYAKDENRKEALRIRNQPPPYGKKPTTEDIFEMGKQNTLQAYKLFLEHQKAMLDVLAEGGKVETRQGFNCMDRFASPAFDFLYKEKLLILTQEQIDSYYEKANTIYLAQLQAQKFANNDPIKDQDFKNRIEKFINDSQLNNRDKSEIQTIQATNIVKQLAVDFYFTIECEAQNLEELGAIIEAQKAKNYLKL